MDWPGLQRLGLVGLGLKPADFWALTPVELWLMAGLEQGGKAMDRRGLDALMALHPDSDRGEMHDGSE